MSEMQRRVEGAVAVVEINRPHARNALNPNVLALLTEALAEYGADDAVRCVIITGAGGTFCAGADITGFDQLRATPLLDDVSTSRTFWSALSVFAKPVIAAVDGLALGGGCELALACDIVIAGTSARFGVPEVKLGVIPGAGGTQRLIRSLGKSTAMAMLLTGDTIPADEAKAAGLVAKVVPDGTVIDEALAMAERICANSPLAVALAKNAALASFETTLSQGLAHERRNFHTALQSADCHEGQAAFLAKRKPVFTGR